MKKQRKKVSPWKLIFIVVALILVIASIMIAYLVVEDLKQEDLLKKEIVNVANKELLKDDYSIEVKTTGDYAYIEEAIKKFYKELSDNIKIMNQYLNDENLSNILSADNIKNDGPKFEKSYKILTDAKTNTTNAINKISSLCDEESIKNLIDKEKVDDYSYDLYLNLMYTKEDLKEFAKTKKEMETLASDLNMFFDKVTEMLNMLERNSNSWEIEDGELYFDKDSLVNEYNNLYNELNKIATEKFSSYETTDNENKQSSI